ncbi:hypothetical protein LJC33_04110 [Eubacteriales bacterium OttesenSCG-928-N13]|nr:hypothetical protein [Eubacteriales bacterium OttesenSCG-928-N13]
MHKKILCLLLMLTLLPGMAFSSPEPDEFRCMLRFTLDMQGILADPFDHWADELAQMIEPTIDYMQWPEGESMRLRVMGNGQQLLLLQLDRAAERVALGCSLMGDGQVLLQGEAAEDALRLLDNTRTVLAPDTDWPYADCTLTVHAGQAAQFLHGLDQLLSRWAADAGPDPQEIALAMAVFSNGIGDLMDKHPSAAPILQVLVQYQPTELSPSEIDPNATAAPDGLSAALVSELPGLLMRKLAQPPVMDG